MANLSDIVASRAAYVGGTETNLEDGEIYVWVGTHDESEAFRCNICWQPGVAGTATIEIWGAGGTGSKQCCCANNVPANSGSYAKMTVEMNSSDCVCGFVGMSCRHNDGLCFEGCSQATCIRVEHLGGCTCMCAQGGQGARVHCSTSTAIACCFGSQYGLYCSYVNDYCRLYCNCCWNQWGCSNIAGSMTGVSNNTCKPSRWGCVCFYHCNACCDCTHVYYVPTAPATFSTEGATIIYTGIGDTVQQVKPGSGIGNVIAGLAAASRGGMHGHTNAHCWNGNRGCACYINWQCATYLPYGMAGFGTHVCDNVRDYGHRGGPGAIRIRFKPST